jgi:hypothetical protein
MPKPFNELRERLLRAGVAPRHVRRYLAELSDHLKDLRTEEARAGRTLAEAESAALTRLGDTDHLARAMTGQRNFQAFAARAPWAAFGLLPLGLLLLLYGVACSILAFGWLIFMPTADTPFGAHPGASIDSLENIWFQTGRMLYFSAPVLVGWTIALAAARQRSRALWPAIGLVVIAWSGGTARISASRTQLPNSLSHISMRMASVSSPHAIPSDLSHAAAILALTALPYILWRVQLARGASA